MRGDIEAEAIGTIPVCLVNRRVEVSKREGLAPQTLHGSKRTDGRRHRSSVDLVRLRHDFVEKVG